MLKLWEPKPFTPEQNELKSRILSDAEGVLLSTMEILKENDKRYPVRYRWLHQFFYYIKWLFNKNTVDPSSPHENWWSCEGGGVTCWQYSQNGTSVFFELMPGSDAIDIRLQCSQYLVGDVDKMLNYLMWRMQRTTTNDRLTFDAPMVENGINVVTGKLMLAESPVPEIVV